MSTTLTDGSRRPGGRFPVANPLALLVGLVLMIAVLGLVVLAARPPAAKGEAAPADEFSAARAMALLERLLGDGAPHPIGTETNARVAARIGDELAAMGYAVETQEAFACRAAWAVCGSVTNVMTRLPGATDGPAVLLTAHYDSVAAGPGAADDMAGVAVILEIARILQVSAAQPLRNPVIFLLSDGEEPALLGAEAFVAEHPWGEQVGVVVNLEANGTHGQSILFESTDDNAWLIDAFAGHAPRPVASSIFDTIYTFLPFNTDLTVYEEAGLPGVNFAFIEEHPQYHTPRDDPPHLSPGSLQHHGDNALAATRVFGAVDLANPPPGRSVYQDVLPGVVLRWPEPWTIWIALVTAVVWIGVAVRVFRHGDLTIRPLLWGLLVLPVGLLGATLLGLALGSGVSAFTGVAMPWYANPLPMRLAIGSGVILGVIVLASLVARRAGFWGMFLGVWLWWTALSVVVAALAPGVSPLVLLPTAIAALAAGVVAVTPLRASFRAWQIAALVALFGAGWFWLGFTRGSDYSALSPDLGPMLGFAVGLVASALAPLVAPPVAYGRLWRPALAVAALLMVIVTVVATQVPASSAWRPFRVNLLHVQDRQSGQAWWAIDDRSGAGVGQASGLQGLMRAGGFTGEPTPLLPWSSQRFPVAPAPPIAAEPVAEVLGDERAGEERIIRLELRSSGAGTRVSLYVPVAAALRRVEVSGRPAALEGLPVEEGYGRFHCVGAGCDGLGLDLYLESNEPLTLYATETAPGLPEGGSALLEVRPDTAAPSGDGDTTLVIDWVELDAP